ncbi:MAG: DsbA family protein [Gammaproteobacteria bacterium]|nr:DsbA family protein [Gammaproteobacteria bacterium]
MRHPPRFLVVVALVVAALFGGRTTPAQGIQKVTAAGIQHILAAPLIEWPAGRKPTVRVVEYFDYNCPFCRRMVPTLRQLVAADPGVTVIFKDWPVLGPASVYAARCALAAGYQGKYQQAHDALLAGPRLGSDPQVLKVLGRAGLDVPRLERDLTAHAREIAKSLARNDAEARALELDGTPGLLVGSFLVPGVLDLKGLEQLVAESR